MEPGIARIGVGQPLRDRPRRLVFTFGVPKFAKEFTRVSIDLKALPTGCELTLTHEGVLPEWLEQSKEGWGMILDSLAASLGEPFEGDRSRS